MGYPITKLIIDGIAHKTVGKAVEAILAKTPTAEAVYEWFGEKTPSLQSAVSVAKKNLNITFTKTAKKTPATTSVSKKKKEVPDESER